MDGMKSREKTGVGVVARMLGVAFILSGALAQDVPVRALELPPGAGNPRNSEGAFVSLKDGRVLFVYSHYTAAKAETTIRPVWPDAIRQTAAETGRRRTGSSLKTKAA